MQVFWVPMVGKFAMVLRQLKICWVVQASPEADVKWMDIQIFPFFSQTVAAFRNFQADGKPIQLKVVYVMYFALSEVSKHCSWIQNAV